MGIHYSDTDVAGVVEDGLNLEYWDGSQWSMVGITVVEHDRANNRLVVTVSHLTEFVLLGEKMRQAYLPLVFKSWAQP